MVALLPLLLVVGVQLLDVVVQYLIEATPLWASLPVALILTLLYQPFDPLVDDAKVTLAVGLVLSTL